VDQCVDGVACEGDYVGCGDDDDDDDDDDDGDGEVGILMVEGPNELQTLCDDCVGEDDDCVCRLFSTVTRAVDGTIAHEVVMTQTSSHSAYKGEQ